MIATTFYVYGLFEGEVCLYVGQTCNPKQRLQAHRYSTLKGFEVGRVSLRVLNVFDSRKASLSKEAELITHYTGIGQASLNTPVNRNDWKPSFQIEIKPELEAPLKLAAEKIGTTPTRLANAILTGIQPPLSPKSKRKSK